jgi:O-succinylbenzoic acid--CoA ligase
MDNREAHTGIDAGGGMRMPDWLSRRAALSPDRPALLAGGARWTFAELDRLVATAARRLAALGVAPGDRVAVLLGNGPDLVALVHAVARTGAVLVPLNTRLTASELAWQLTDAGARLLVYDGPHAAAAVAAGRMAPGLSLVPVAGAAAREQPLPPTPSPRAPPAERGSPARDGAGLSFSTASRGRREGTAQLRAKLPLSAGGARGEGVGGRGSAEVPLRDWIDLSAVHSIQYTSGTTGRPKGAMLTYGNHWWSAVGSALNLGNQQDDCWLAVLPLFHVGGMSILMRSVIYGIPAVVHPSFDPAAANRAIDEDRVTIVSVVGVMLRRMLEERGARPYPAWLRCVLLGGGPAPRALLETCARRGVPVIQTYGLTETASQVATLAPVDALRKLGSAGKPLLPTELRIDRDGTPAAPGEAGEIVVRGPTVTSGYVNRPDETARAIRDGWLRTGDLGYLDGEGYLYVLDRRDDLIISGGENVYPAEVEAALLAHPDIEEAAVVGVPHAHWGQIPVAAVKLRQGGALGEREVTAFCAERLARYKVPARVRFVDALPRNAAGKLLRNVVREAFATASARHGEQ